MGYRQAVRHSTLTAAFASSNLASPVKVKIKYGILAQLVEHLTFNQVVRGSNPRCLIRITKTSLVRVGFLLSLGTARDEKPVGSESLMSHIRKSKDNKHRPPHQQERAYERAKPASIVRRFSEKEP